MIYEVGKQFPEKHYQQGADIARIRTLEGGTFDFLMYMNKPSIAEIESAKTGSLKYALYIKNYIPFFILNFGKFNLDAPFNILKVQKEHALEWMKTEANAVNLFLIDSADNTIKAMRLIGVDLQVMKNFKVACAKQIENYTSVRDVDFATDAIMERYSTEAMWHDCKIYKV
jgi:hypothetical protein